MYWYQQPGGPGKSNSVNVNMFHLVLTRDPRGKWNPGFRDINECRPGSIGVSELKENDPFSCATLSPHSFNVNHRFHGRTYDSQQATCAKAQHNRALLGHRSFQTKSTTEDIFGITGCPSTANKPGGLSRAFTTG